jgi:hypothetical protein
LYVVGVDYSDGVVRLRRHDLAGLAIVALGITIYFAWKLKRPGF